MMEIAMYWASGQRACIVDVPLLIEVGMRKWMGIVVIVHW